MKAKERHRIKLLEYIANPDNEWLSRSRLSTEALGFRRGNQVYCVFTPEEMNQIEREALELRRRKYSSHLAKIDLSVLSAAAEGDTAAARLAYQRFEGWSEKQSHEHTGKDGKSINHNLTMDEMAAQLLAEVAGATRGLPNRFQEKIEE